MSEARRLLVTGGAGFIGSHMVTMLLEDGHQVVTLDNLSTGKRDAVSGGTFVQGDFQDPDVLNGILQGPEKIDGILHFAASTDVEESMANPAKYMENNVQATQALVDCLAGHDPVPIVFSSTCAVYGNPHSLPIDETHPVAPESTYARSKLMAEEVLETQAGEQKSPFVILRYFNAAGADPEGRMGERRDNPTHLIPKIFSAADGSQAEMTVFGNDYETPDGTAIRDFVHVTDLCRAHLLALQWLWEGKENSVFNLGTGNGNSVLGVIEIARMVTGKDIPVTFAPRRSGDLEALVADNSRATRELGWTPRYGDIETILEHAWRWHLKVSRS